MGKGFYTGMKPRGFFLSLSLFFFFSPPTEQDRCLTTVSILLTSWNLGLWVWEIQDQISGQMHSTEGCNPRSRTCELSWPLGYLKQQHSWDLGKSQTKKWRQWKVPCNFIWSSTELWCRQMKIFLKFYFNWSFLTKPKYSTDILKGGHYFFQFFRGIKLP